MKTLWLTDAKDLLKIYLEQEDANYHSSNYVLLAKAYGTDEEIETCLINREMTHKQGFADSELSRAAYDAANRYYYKLVVDAQPTITKDDESKLWRKINPTHK